MVGLISRWRLAELMRTPKNITNDELKLLLALYKDLMDSANKVQRLNRAADLDQRGSGSNEPRS